MCEIANPLQRKLQQLLSRRLVRPEATPHKTRSRVYGVVGDAKHLQCGAIVQCLVHVWMVDELAQGHGEDVVVRVEDVKCGDVVERCVGGGGLFVEDVLRPHDEVRPWPYVARVGATGLDGWGLGVRAGLVDTAHGDLVGKFVCAEDAVEWVSELRDDLCVGGEQLDDTKVVVACEQLAAW